VDLLAAWVTYNGNSSVAFGRAAREILNARSEVASLELQPNGIVTDIYPRAGNERGMGFNVLRGPVHQQSARLAVQRRSTTLVGPLPLYTGDTGFVLLTPIFQGARGGRESPWWGFVAASTKLSVLLARAGVHDLTAKGYLFTLRCPGLLGRPTVTLAAEGEPLAAESATFRMHNLELRLALEPRRGWVDWRGVAAETTAVCLSAALLWVSIAVWTLRHKAASAARDAEEGLAESQAQQKEAEDKCRDYQERAQALLNDLKKVRAHGAELDAQLAAAIHRHEESTAVAEARRLELENRAAQFQAQLESGAAAAANAAREHETERAEASAKLDKAEQAIKTLEKRLADCAWAERLGAERTRAERERDAAAIADLVSRLDDEKAAAAKAHESIEELRRECDAIKVEWHKQLRRSEEAEQRAAILQGRVRNELVDSEESATAERVDHPAPEQATPATPETTSRVSAPELDVAGGGEEATVPASVNQAHDEAAPPTPADPPPEAVSEVLLSPPESQPETPVPVPKTAEPTLKLPRARKSPASAQLSFFGAEQTPALPPPPPARPKEHRPPTAAEVGEFRKLVHQILPLLADHDPGAKDCLRENRQTFRAVLSSDALGDFEQAVRGDGFDAALDQLRKAAKKYGITV
jgi:sensor domain CHASE-containing protein